MVKRPNEKERHILLYSWGYRFVKRTFDIVTSLAGLLLLSPLFLFVSAAIFFDDPHTSPIFVQTRTGKNGVEFRFFKFRSMVANAESFLDGLLDCNEVDGPVFKIKEDSRVTRVGRVVRRTCIDELPQLWNVLKDDMSLVAPCPLLLAEREAYGRHLTAIMSVRPGVTGYWQVHGRSDIAFQERIELNEYYIAHQSILLDLKILLETVKVVVTKEGAE